MSTIKKLAGFFAGAFAEKRTLTGNGSSMSVETERNDGSARTTFRNNRNNRNSIVHRVLKRGRGHMPKLTGHYRVNVRWRRRAVVKGWI